jgi:hypothetical protein
VDGKRNDGHTFCADVSSAENERVPFIMRLAGIGSPLSLIGKPHKTLNTNLGILEGIALNITMCPPAPAHFLDDSEPIFYKRAMPVQNARFDADGEPSNTSMLSFGDMDSMHVVNNKGGRVKRRIPTPLWVYNPETMQEVITRLVESRALFKGPGSGSVRERLERAEKRCMELRESKIRVLDRLCEEYLVAKYSPGNEARAKFLARKVEEIDTQICLMTRPAATVAAVLFYSFRVGLNSTSVAHVLRTVKPPLVRHIIHKARKAADVYIGVQPAPERGFGIHQCQKPRSPKQERPAR